MLEGKILCPRWGRCKAAKKCPLEKYKVDMSKVYVYGKCASEKVKIVTKMQLEEYTRSLYKSRQKDRQPSPQKKK